MSDSPEIKKKRKQLVAIREEVENLIDYLDVLEARVDDQAKPRWTHGDVLKRYPANWKRS